MSEPPQAHGDRRLLQVASRLLERQQEALFQRDLGALKRHCDALADLLVELSEEPRDQWSAEHVGLARRIREQIRLNMILLRNGMAIVDNFAQAVARVASPADPALFSEVA